MREKGGGCGGSHRGASGERNSFDSAKLSIQNERRDAAQAVNITHADKSPESAQTAAPAFLS
jgi:hypothetical protein